MDITNYLIEANLGLIFFSVVYFALLHRETQFKVKRAYLLGAMLASVVFPLIEFQFLVPQIYTANFIPEVYLPEIMIGTDSAQTVSNSTNFSFWNVAAWTYGIVAGLLLIRFLIQLGKLFYYLKFQTFYEDGRFKIAESATASYTFSFFQYIVIGNVDQLARDEKEKIIQHEKTHATRFHSFDIILTELFIIAFWFNPLVYSLKKQLISIHEFEADQQSIEYTDASSYCNLLARVSLLSAGFSFVNHFNNSLTLKRIAMINTNKTKMSYWKYVAIIPVFIGALILAACSDESLSVMKLSQNGLNLPKEIRTMLENEPGVKMPDGTMKTRFQMMEEWKAKNPGAEFILGKSTGEPSKSVSNEIFEDAIERYKKEYKKADGQISFISVVPKKDESGKTKEVIYILGMTDYKPAITTFKTPENTSEKSVYEAVHQPPTFQGGFAAMQEYLKKEMKYPTLARANKIEGRVFISFIVDSEGNVTDPAIVQSIGYGCDEEAYRVVAGFPKWNPGKQDGKPVNVKYVIPINFAL